MSIKNCVSGLQIPACLQQSGQTGQDLFGLEWHQLNLLPPDEFEMYTCGKMAIVIDPRATVDANIKTLLLLYDCLLLD